jgi:hypothetical protein
MSLQEERKTLQNKIIAVTRTIETAKDQYQVIVDFIVNYMILLF